MYRESLRDGTDLRRGEQQQPPIYRMVRYALGSHRLPRPPHDIYSRMGAVHCPRGKVHHSYRSRYGRYKRVPVTIREHVDLGAHSRATRLGAMELFPDVPAQSCLSLRRASHPRTLGPEWLRVGDTARCSAAWAPMLASRPPHVSDLIRFRCPRPLPQAMGHTSQ